MDGSDILEIKLKVKLGRRSQVVTSFPSKVPGGIYTDLYNANLIAANLVGDNDIKHRWLSNETFSYIRHFQVNSTSWKPTGRAILIFHGLDTFTTIFLNGQQIGKTSNMYLKYSFDVKHQLLDGTNELKIIFASAVKAAEELYNKQAMNYIVPPTCVPNTYHGECHVNHIRKMQASFGWDWGPAFPSMGIWKDVELITVENVLMSDVTVDIGKSDAVWEVEVTIFFQLLSSDLNKWIKCDLRAELKISELAIISNSKVTVLDTNATNCSIVLRVPKEAVHLWWPNGYGEQRLYNLKVQSLIGQESTEKNIRIGFRTVELVQEPLEKGLSFYFRLNEVPIFAKGSNWIPASIFPEETANEETVRDLLFSAREAHMNMLRVWGGGVYESDFFYNLADEYGIMIWQDFMFACSMYPAGESFLESVKAEVEQNVKRLKNHPSIVLWAGNNENEAALYGNWYGTGSTSIYQEDYIRLYVNVIKAEVNRIDPARPFVVSSPSDGLFTEENNYVGPNPYSNLYGDVHYYNYLKNGWDINHYPHTRFASEYGFQSLPSVFTLAPVIKNETDLRIDSDFMLHRQHLPAGYNYMKNLISMNFRVSLKNTYQDFLIFIYLSQVNQAVSMRIETESYRQTKSGFNANGEGLTMGALYWQLNDVWQAPSWSSIEFGGRWKMLHYYVKDCFAPVIVTPHLSLADELTIYVVSDKLVPISDCTLSINVYKWDMNLPLYTKKYPNIVIMKNMAQAVVTLWFSNFLREAGCGTLAAVKKNCIVELLLEDQYHMQIAPYNYVYPSSFINITVPNTEVQVYVDPTPIPGKLSNYLDYRVSLRSEKIALFVWIDVKQICGRFSENGFHVLRGEKNITFHAKEAVTDDQLSNDITVVSLSQIYKFKTGFM
ncbi:beta-mannosidase isoform X2 [Cephus cinctus]|uniref:Beta-mannosidase n=1 Tax=Cephus cinctus TaxID=211228 RepID=A0AAJ7FDW4_CEPCN|nr:beta-mannosidase isoform X2 [Cephus cinctus]